MTINNKSKKTKSLTFKKFKKIARIVGTTVLSILMVFVISASILSTALTVYVLNFVDDASLVSLDNLNLSYATTLFAKNKDGEYVSIYSIAGEKKCVWVDIENIPQVVQDAFVFAEDARFYYHDGVDFKRTFTAFANYFLKFLSSAQGGSTITQQLVKNITDDKAQTPDRKIREMFSSINMERNYTKTDILEAYMNIAPFWYNMHGVQTAANFYFNKDVSQLTAAEAASIVAITKSPKYNNPIDYPENNKKRRNYILGQMYKYGSLSSEEYEAAKAEELKIVGYNKIEDQNKAVETVDATKASGVSSYFVDSAINQAIEIFMSKYGIDKDAALRKLRTGGYQIYTTENIDLQATIENKMKDPKTFSMYEQKNPVDAAFIAMDYKGNVVGVVGGYGEKKSTLSFNYATDGKRQPGSTIKPIASYGPALEYNMIHWSTMLKDEPLQVPDGMGGLTDFLSKNQDGEEEPWPKNYELTYERVNRPLNYCLQISRNTAAARIIEDLTPKKAYDFLKDRFHITTLAASDMDRSPMAIGGLTNGLTLKELVAAYQAFGNLGSYYSPTFITSIVASDGTKIYQHEYKRSQALSSDTAYVMNRMMKQVVDAGTGTAAKTGINGVEIVGKTGTTMDRKDLLFVGCTPEYVAGVWYGYGKTPAFIPKTYYTSSKIWNNIFRDVVNGEQKKTFDADPTVEEHDYCTETGYLAGPGCPSTAKGYYRKSNVPPMCPTHNNGTTTTDENQNQE